MKRIPSLDGLRAISIGLVLLGHLYGTTGYPKNRATEFLGAFSHFGVQVFFVISGFLITSLLLREREDTGRISLKAFYLRRTFRIFPAAWLYILFATGMRFLLHHPFPLKYVAFAITYTWCYVNGGPWVLGHLWSLSVEEQFYLLWPLAMVFLFPWRKPVSWSVMLLAPLARLIYAHYSPDRIDYAFPAVADALAAGCLLALYRPGLPRSPRWLRSLPAVLACCGMTMGVSLVPLPVWSTGVVPLLIALSIWLLVDRADPLLNNGVTSFLGALSYSLYLYQQPFVTQSPTSNLWSSFPINLVLTFGFALSSFYLVEKPLLRVGHRLNARLLRKEARLRALV